MKLLSIPSLEVSRTVGACSITTSINDNSVRHLLSSLLPLTSALYKGIRWNADQFGIFRLNPRGLASFASVSICAPVAPKRKYKYTNTQMTRGLASFVDVLICAPWLPSSRPQQPATRGGQTITKWEDWRKENYLRNLNTMLQIMPFTQNAVK